MLVAEGYEALAAVAAATPERAVAEVPLLEMLPGGSVLIHKELYGEPEVIVDQPWAKDATGPPLPTKYLGKGDRLIQTIDVPGDATFPVVADPKLRKYWWGISYDFNKTETKKSRQVGRFARESSPQQLHWLRAQQVRSLRELAGWLLVWRHGLMLRGSASRFVYFTCRGPRFLGSELVERLRGRERLT